MDAIMDKPDGREVVDVSTVRDFSSFLAWSGSWGFVVDINATTSKD